MSAKNTGQAEYPKGSVAVYLSEEKIQPEPGSEGSAIGSGNISEDRVVYIIKERSDFYVDGISHKYYIPAGENFFWNYNRDTNGKVYENLKNKVTLEVPKIEGISIDIEKIEIKSRDFFALDSRINYFFKNSFDITHINRSLTPSYVFLIFSSILILLYPAITSRVCWHRRKPKPDKPVSGNPRHGLLSYKRPIVTIAVIIIVLLSAFSLYFIGNYIYTVKSYVDSYKNYILEGKLGETYRGFYDFEDFIDWIDGNVPEQENIIVLINGSPVYMMAELAYNLYPRDIKFIDIGDKDDTEIISEIESINNNLHLDQNTQINKEATQTYYKYIIILTEKDIPSSEKLELINKYRPTGGYLFFFNE